MSDNVETVDDLFAQIDSAEKEKEIAKQEIKKVIEDADEIIAELNYTSEMVVKDIEEKLGGLKEELKKLSTASTAATSSVSPIASTADKKEAPQPLINVRKKKKITNDGPENTEVTEGKLNSKQQAVFDYAAQGMSVTDIAKQLNIGQGEVMLILSLNNEVE
jgi:DNA-binding NarL/FixJ family response regulator